MGIFSFAEPRPRLVFPGTPPELVSPSSSTYSSRPSEAATASPPPMSHHDQLTAAERLPGKPVEEKPASAAAAAAVPLPTLPPPLPAQGASSWLLQQQQQPPKQVLPPLSSILKFSDEGRPQRSPLFEDHRPTFSASNSPLDRPSHPSRLERSHSSSSTSSFFQPSATPTSAAPRSGGPFEERNPFHTLPRPQFPGPVSPQAQEPDGHRQPQRGRTYQRSDYGQGRDPQPPPYQLASTPSSSTPSSSASAPAQHHQQHPQHQQQQQHRFPPPITILGNRHYGDLQIIHSSHGPQPPTPAGSVLNVPEGVPGKDALGPKIWTGTHFLPRFVRAAEVPGEGMCYFYDDGSHCKTVIDGEAVNAHWGVTKAGKPRKRLAIACVTCREKKIKCDPDFPRCVQCEKFGRVCKFKNAPRGGNNTSPSTPTADLDDSPRLSSRRPAGEDEHRPPRPPADPRRPGSMSSASVSPRTVPRPAPPEMVNSAPSKRPRIDYELHHQRPPHGLPPPIQPPDYQHQHQHRRPGDYNLNAHPTLLPSIEDFGRRSRSPVMLPPLPTKPLPEPVPGSRMGTAPTNMAWSQPKLPRIHDDVHRRAWQADPRGSPL